MRLLAISKTLSFGHELDDKKAEAERKWSAAYDKAADYRKRVEDENKDFYKKSKDFEDRIQEAKNKETDTFSIISQKQSKIKTLENYIETKKNKANTLLDEIKVNSQKVQEKNDKYNLNLQDFINLKTKTTQNHSSILQKTQISYQNEYNAILNGIKSQLIKKLINPINLRYKDNPPEIASSIFITDILPEDNIKQNSLYEKILTWAVNITNSNFGHINTEDFSQQPINIFFENLKKILFSSNKLYETEGRHSITLLSNLQTIINNLSQNENNTLSDLLNKSAEIFHNSFIVISKQNEQIKELFNSKLFLDDFFINNLQFGVKSFEDIIKNKPTLGKNLQSFFR